jgi:GNAT superfamily N-acetyltransferase
MPQPAFTPRLRFLDGRESIADRLAEVHAREWSHLYGEAWGAAAALAEFRGHRTDGTIPATIVLESGGEVAGSVSVVTGDCPARPDLDPWLASLHVSPNHRGLGHARTLVQAAVDLAARNGFDSLHVFTESADRLFEQCGFVQFADATLHGHAIRILRHPLARTGDDASRPI